MNESSTAKSTTYQAYRQYVEFINELRITNPFATILLAAPTLISLADLLYALGPDHSFIKEITYLGVSTVVSQISQKSPSLGLAVGAICLGMLLWPLVAIGWILGGKMSEEKYSNGVFKRKYNKSLINLSLRMHFACFIHLILPLTASLATKFIVSAVLPASIAIAMLLLVCLNCFAMQYHTFQLGVSKQEELIVANFPYRLIDNLFVFLLAVTVNSTYDIAPILFSIALTLLRLATTVYFPFYLGWAQTTHRFILVSSLISCFGILTAYLDQQYYIFLIISVCLVLLLATVKKAPAEEPWQAVEEVEDGSSSILKIKERLLQEGCYVRAFRELIMEARKNNSHRTLLYIEILKSRCTDLERLNRGGGSKCSSVDIIQFEECTVQFIENVLKACELSISILRCLQLREVRKYIVSREINRLIAYLLENREVIRRMLEINQYSVEVRVLLRQIYAEFVQDHSFTKSIQQQLGELVAATGEREIKDKYFSEKTTVIFINILEEIGKIVKISKNVPAVLGFTPSNLIGLSINEVIPFSVKEHHDGNILRFIQKCNEKDKYNNFELQFYAYNSEFHLQEVKIYYNWVMTDFHSFHMAGLIQKVESDANIILTDQFGYLEGWTKRIGSEEFNFDEMSIAERKNFNVMPLFPTLIKYMDSLGVYARTIFFKNQKTRDPNLIIVDKNKHEHLPAFQAKLLSTFRKMVKQEELVGACFAQIEMTRLDLCAGKAKMFKFVIKQYERIENFSELTAMIESLAFTSTNRTDKSILEPTNEIAEGSQKQELSIFSEDEKTDNKIDSNFSLEPQGPHIIPLEQLVFGQFNASRTSFELSNMYQQHLKKRNDKEQRRSSPHNENSLTPNLQKYGTLLVYVGLVTVASAALIIWNMVSVGSGGRLMEEECRSVVIRNRAAGIYLKSIFNPNATYIGQFTNGELTEKRSYLFTRYLNYTTFLGNSITENKYYLFNTQVPATLQRLLQNPISQGGGVTSTVPSVSSYYYQELVYNYKQIVRQYHLKFQDTLDEWSQVISSLKSAFFFRVAFLALTSALFAFLLVLLYLRQRNYKQTLEALFKFEKEDLERKIGQIGQVVRRVESQAGEWHLLKELNEIVKRENISNVDFTLIKNTHEVKIKFEYGIEEETALENRKYYHTALIIAVLLAFQGLFVALHLIFNLNALAYYQQTPSDLDRAAKLIILPNYLLADLYLPMPGDLSDTYQSNVAEVLTLPVASIPNLYNILSSPPCLNCNFMYPVLKTNYKSFYSTFQQQVAEMKMSSKVNSSQVEDIFYAADYVISNLLGVLSVRAYEYMDLSLLVWVVGVAVVWVGVWRGSGEMREEVQKLELFLKLFSEQVILKNKHMNRLFSSNQ